MTAMYMPYHSSSDASKVYRSTSSAPSAGRDMTAVQGNLSSVMMNWQISRAVVLSGSTVHWTKK